MSPSSGSKTLTSILSIATLGAALSFGMGTALAAEEKAKDKNVTEGEILRALVPEKKPLTRGLSVGPQQVDQAAVAAEGQFVQKIRGRSTRSLSVSEREEIAAIVKDKPKIDLEINFDYNSAEISARSLASVEALGRALSNNELQGSTFVWLVEQGKATRRQVDLGVRTPGFVEARTGVESAGDHVGHRQGQGSSQ